MVRLFDRGNLEEKRFVTWLRNAGVEVQEYEPGTRRQMRVSAFGGHFGGSLDAKLRNVPDWHDPDDWILGEFKTHNQKSFDKLQKSGVAGAKWVHFIQMQIYMLLMGLPAALYMAINKNTDELYTELVPFNEQLAMEYMRRAEMIIKSPVPPKKINESAGWYECKWCDMRGVCHSGHPLALNCRTCAYVTPQDDATWLCTKYQYVLSDHEQRIGCTSHHPITAGV